MPKKNLTMFMLILFLSSFALIACSGKELSEDDYTVSHPFDGFSVNEQGILIVIDNILWFYDFKNDEKIVVCNVPNCSHEPFNRHTNPDPICLATLPADGSFGAVGLYDNNVYTFVQEWEKTTVYQIDLEGNGRKELPTFDWEVNFINTFEMKDGLAYFTVTKPIMEVDPETGASFSTSFEFAVMSLDLKTGKVTQHGEVKDDNYAAMHQFKKIDDKLYYLYYYLDFEDEYDFSIDDGERNEYDRWELYEIDIAKNEERIVLNLTEIDDQLLYDYNEDHLYFLSTDLTEFVETNWDRTESEVLFTGEDISISSRLGDGFIYSQHNLYDGTYYHYDLKSKKTRPFKRPDWERNVKHADNERVYFDANFEDGQYDLVSMKKDDFFAGKTNYTILRDGGLFR